MRSSEEKNYTSTFHNRVPSLNFIHRNTSSKWSLFIYIFFSFLCVLAFFFSIQKSKLLLSVLWRIVNNNKRWKWFLKINKSSVRALYKDWLQLLSSGNCCKQTAITLHKKISLGMKSNCIMINKSCMCVSIILTRNTN